MEVDLEVIEAKTIPFSFPIQMITTISPQKPQIFYQICNRPNHVAIDYYRQMNYAYQGKFSPVKLFCNNSYSIPGILITFSEKYFSHFIIFLVVN